MARKKLIDHDTEADEGASEPRERALHPSEIIPGTAHNSYGLTFKQEMFVRAWLINGNNATRAYMQSYDCSNMTVKSAGELACVLLKNVKIKSRIEAAREKLALRTDLSLLRIKQELERIALAKLSNVARWDKHGLALLHSDLVDDEDMAAIQEVGETVTKYGSSMRIKMYDKQSALQTLARMHGGLDPDKDVDTEVTITGGLPAAEGRV